MIIFLGLTEALIAIDKLPWLSSSKSEFLYWLLRILQHKIDCYAGTENKTHGSICPKFFG
jgi:hypothetical protein